MEWSDKITIVNIFETLGAQFSRKNSSIIYVRLDVLVLKDRKLETFRVKGDINCDVGYI